MARRSSRSFGSLDDLYTQQAIPSAWQRQQMFGPEAEAQRKAIGSVNPNLLSLSEREATPQGRSYFDPERIEERGNRIISRNQSAALSPFNQMGGGGGGYGGMSQRMSNSSIMGAIRGGMGGQTDPGAWGAPKRNRSGQTSLTPPTGRQMPPMKKPIGMARLGR